MSDDARYLRELEMRCNLLEQAFLLQEKRVWSQGMLDEMARGQFMGNAPEVERARTRELLRGNLRVASEMLDRVAQDLGYDQPTVFRMLDPEFVLGAKDEEIPPALEEQLRRVDSKERESGQSHVRAMCRDLKTRHDAFLVQVQRRVRDDVELHTVFESLAFDGTSSSQG